MTDEPDPLRDIFLEVLDEPTLTERREEGPSRVPNVADEAAVEETVSDLLRNDGLVDAVDDPGPGSDVATG